MPVPPVTRVLVADDHPLVRSGLRKVLDARADLEVVAEAEDGREAVERALREDVHLAILDVSMPRLTGIQAAAELRRRKPELRVLMLISIKTVDRHRQNILQKLGMRDRVELTRYAIRRGLIQP
jgi:DNA-binding NarL/FixJ family response regulator